MTKIGKIKISIIVLISLGFLFSLFTNSKANDFNELFLTNEKIELEFEDEELGDDPVATETLLEDPCICCTTTLTEIQNTTTGASFWIDSRISYGDILISTLLMIILIGLIGSALISFLIPKRMNFKRQ